MLEIKDKYKELVGADLTEEQLLRIARVERVLDLRKYDSIWAIILAFEFYEKVFLELNSRVIFWSRVQMVISILCTAVILYEVR